MYSYTAVYVGEMSMVNPITYLFSLFEALSDAFEVLIFRAYQNLSMTLIARRAMQLRFLKVETLLMHLMFKLDEISGNIAF